jgi:two-component system, chemotaxis family, sensor histidine kinase and response regulator WspE
MNGKHEHAPDLFKLFLNDLHSQLTTFNLILNDIDKPDFLVLNEAKLLKITRNLIASSKVIQLKSLQLLIQAFEDYIIFLKGTHNLITKDKELIKKTYLSLHEIEPVAENDVHSVVAQKAGQYQILMEQFKEREHSAKKMPEPSTVATHISVPEKKMLELFKMEMETQVKILSEGLLLYQHEKENLKLLEPLMRAAHSIKGAAKVFSFNPMVQLAHAIEDCLIAAQEGKITLDDDRSEVLFLALDEMGSFANVPTMEIESKISSEQKKLERLSEEIKKFSFERDSVAEIHDLLAKEAKTSHDESTGKKELEHEDRVLRLTAQNLNRLMGLAAESMVETRWLRPFCDSLLRLKTIYSQIVAQSEMLKNSLEADAFDEKSRAYYQALNHTMHDYQNQLSDRVVDLEMFITRHSNLTDRLYGEVIESRMRPFSDGVSGFPRMVWETARELKKKARLDVEGQLTLIDRDILEKLEVPLGHLLRNAIDHGIESPEERVAAGKPPEGVIHLKASHKAGMLAITISDDGRGVDLGVLRKKIVEEKLITEDLAAKLSVNELLDFLFLPGFSTSTLVTDLSGRGIGLNIVQNMLQDVSGSIHIDNRPGKGISFHLQLPLTLSVIRALITRVDKGVFAFPLARIEQALTLSRSEIQQVETREYFTYQGINIGLVPAVLILNLGNYIPLKPSALPVVILQNHANYYGIIVDEFLGEKELVLQDIEARLGNIPCISCGSVLENGDPVLIMDVEDLIESVDKFLSTGKIYKIEYEKEKPLTTKKRILVVDDSISVREVECRLLKNKGYQVDWAVNGVDAWNAIRLGNYDLVVTDVDMPRMNGIELTRNVKNDVRLKNLPVMIVSYKERENDRILGLNAGANYYLAKSTFGDEALIKAVVDLIGEP